MPVPAIDRRELEKLCDLARLRLPAEREAEILTHLQRIVDAFAALREVDTTALPAIAPGGDPGAAVRLRDDLPGDVLPRERVLANAPRQAADMFLVPRVVDA